MDHYLKPETSMSSPNIAIFMERATSGNAQPLLDDGRQFLSLDEDGEQLPSDWYLKLADYAGRALRREIPLTEIRPIDP
jgi:hypothetical protein